MAKFPMKKIPANGLYVSRPTWWLESRFHFSFAEYYNPSNTEFGVLRVLNDDLVQPHSGFGRHPHRDMEIITYVIDGSITHKDSTGTSESLGRGCVQYMSAGTGVTHSEMNDSDSLLRFLQIWVKPNARGLKPNYGSRSFTKEQRLNKIQHVVTSFDACGGKTDAHSGSGIIPVHQDVNIYVSEMEAGAITPPSFTLQRRRQMYLVCIEGGVTVGASQKGASDQEVKLAARDAVEIVAPKGSDLHLSFSPDSKTGAHLLFLEMAQKASPSAYDD